MFYKFFIFSVLFFSLGTSYAQSPSISYQTKIDAYINKYQFDTPKLTRVQNKIENILHKYSSLDKKIILKELNEHLKIYLKNVASHGAHITTPTSVKSLYYTAYSASREDKIDYLIKLVKTSEINAIVIDIKEIDGYTSFYFPPNSFWDIKAQTNNRIEDIQALIKKLHENNIYLIGRIVVFKDNYLSKKRPDLAIKSLNQKNVLWKDYKGNNYTNPFVKEVWDYHIEIASNAYKMWFDEINFDYVRFPSDGYINQTYYPFASKNQNTMWKTGKIRLMEEFSSYVTSKLRKIHPNIIISADIFGLATHTSLYQIGQNIEAFIPYFDYVAPMIYPSHYGKWYLGFDIPDNAPYEIFYDSITKAQKKIDILNSSSSGSLAISYTKIRPWIQGFNCSWCSGATTYNKEKFRKQIQALNKLWIDSWYVWNASGRYQSSWYEKK